MKTTANDDERYHLSIKLESEDGNHLRMLRLQYQRLLMYRKHDLRYLDLQQAVQLPVNGVNPSGCGGVVKKLSQPI
jgi:predicted GNAT family acetyltransferase